jgi:hypothetical protein
MMEEKDLPELFLCMICGHYFHTDELKEVKVKELLFPKNICITCFNGLKTGGKSEVINLPEENP